MHPKQIMNQIIDQINEAAAANQPLVLDAEEVKILAEEIGDLHFVPVLTNEQIVQLCKEGKLGQKIVD
jgi:Zn finger protein HypA/HybF involved in hydrogenase expression